MFSNRRDMQDPLEGVSLRLTYRTMRALTVIAAQPGLSNSARTGIKDQGRISKLLARLSGLGLIENAAEGHVKGTTNAWHLTPEGSHLERRVGASLSVNPAGGRA